jgi:hypothetical protein
MAESGGTHAEEAVAILDAGSCSCGRVSAFVQTLFKGFCPEHRSVPARINRPHNLPPPANGYFELKCHLHCARMLQGEISRMREIWRVGVGVGVGG